jgi:5-methyltetrahydrofolate--homocysteine methyltransferase
MKYEDVIKRLTEAIANIDYERTLDVCREAVSKGISPADVIAALSEGMRIIGEKFEMREYFLSELIMAGEIMKEAQEILKPHLKAGQVKVPGKVVIGTVAGDLHDIGKNIVVSLLLSMGFDVLDLGVDVSAERFVEAVRKVQPGILGMSALLRATVPEMGNVINELKNEGLRDGVKIIVGGLPLNEEYAKKLGADYYAPDAWKGVEIIRKVVEKS